MQAILWIITLNTNLRHNTVRYEKPNSLVQLGDVHCMDLSIVRSSVTLLSPRSLMQGRYAPFHVVRNVCTRAGLLLLSSMTEVYASMRPDKKSLPGRTTVRSCMSK